MAFTKHGDGTTIWADPTEEEVARNRDKIMNPEAYNNPVAVPAAVQAQLQRLISEQAFGHQRYANSSRLLLKAVDRSVHDPGVVDIIVPVYNALRIVKQCLNSVVERTEWPYRLIIVDDCSDKTTHRYLTEFAAEHPQVNMYRNNKNRGFAATVNRGIKAGNGKFVCVLNSDVLVTPGWLTKMVFALNADPRNQICNPCTNNTAVIDVPFQPGASYIDMNKALECSSFRRYPEIMPTGFCFMFKRQLLEDVGLFDEAYVSYGEETDFWMKTVWRVRNGEYLQYRAVLADDTYIFHERGSSFTQLGDTAHMEQRNTSSARFKRLWPSYQTWAKSWDAKKTLGALRQPLPAMILNPAKPLYNVVFVVHSAAYCGGMRLIADIVNELNERGAHAKVALIKRPGVAPEKTLSELRTAPLMYEGDEDFLARAAADFDPDSLVIAATAELTPQVKALCDRVRTYTPVLFSQSYDADLATTEDVKEKMYDNMKLLPNCIAAVNWLGEFYKSEGMNVLGVSGVGIDLDTFYPRGRDNGDERPTLMLSMDGPNLPWRGYYRGAALANAVKAEAEKRGVDIRIMAFGIEVLPEAPHVVCLGKLGQGRLATVLGTEVDVFCDPSTFHSYGLPVVEAMASGCVPVLWQYKGQEEIFRLQSNEEAALIWHPAYPVEQAANDILNLLDKDFPIARMQAAARTLALTQDRQNAVAKFIETLEHSFALRANRRKIVMVTPHLRKHGGPTTIVNLANELAEKGHDVKLLTIYSDINPEILEGVKVPVLVDINNIPECDVLITNSDNPYNPHFNALKQAKHKILLKLSHNARFIGEENGSLNLKWDYVVTSTKWLTDVCLNPTKEEGWDYLPCKAARVGWFHYGHEAFACRPENHLYGDGKTRPIVIASLVHHHPLKGSANAFQALEKIKSMYGNQVHIVGIGEVPEFKPPPWIQYIKDANRMALADLFKQIDIWVSASETEGLGRMALEAMSAGTVCVLSDTKAEFVAPGSNCLVYPIGDIQAMMDAINKLLMDHPLRTSLAEAGFHTAAALADPRPCIKALDAVIQEVCQ